jgi:hypothetical protein
MNWWSWSGSSSATSTTVTLPACRAVCSRWNHALSTPYREVRDVSALPPLIAAASPTSYAKKVARKGWLPVLQWALANGCPWDHWTCAVAAGHLEVLPWLRANGCPWDSETCALAGNLDDDAAHPQQHEQVQTRTFFLNSATLPKDSLMSCSSGRGPTACANASDRGHLEVLK